MNKRFVYLSTIFAGIIILSTLATAMGGIFDVEQYSKTGPHCLPKSLSEVSTAFEVKLPDIQTMPNNYKLEGIDNVGDWLALYYTDKTLCPFSGSMTDKINEGAVVITASQPEGIVSGLEFQKTALNPGIENSKSVIVPVDVNGNKGVGWEPFTGVDETKLNGEIIESSPLQMPGMVRFYDESDGTVYNIMGFQSMDELLSIAKSIR